MRPEDKEDDDDGVGAAAGSRFKDSNDCFFFFFFDDTGFAAGESSLGFGWSKRVLSANRIKPMIRNTVPMTPTRKVRYTPSIQGPSAPVRVVSGKQARREAYLS